MSAHSRFEAVQDFVARTARSVQYPSKSEVGCATDSRAGSTGNIGGDRTATVSQLFGKNVYGMEQLKATLPKASFQKFQRQVAGDLTMDKETADAIAHAVRHWALERGATHFTHWFQPQTNSTAEKHDSFLTLKYSSDGANIQTTAFDSFTGSQLMQAEPDASSFPNGGARSTFEARGYTVWDTTSPMFLQDGPHGTKILYIPSVFISYHGAALDEKTILLRSANAVNMAAIRLLHALGDRTTRRVHVTLGTEQEFFLVDRKLYSLRPDLKMTGRTLIGAVPPKHQQLEDHYFASVPFRVLSALSEAELELWKLGVPIKTRHNEVAPQQFEMAPIFEEASVAVDHNLLTMQILHRVAHLHKLKVLFHEKPFKGVNGSGKHCNWSLSTDTGVNLLEPTETPECNIKFQAILVSILLGLSKHAGLLRATIASASNEHRLGANEAPPSIISAFLGSQLDDLLNAIEENRAVGEGFRQENQSVVVGQTVLDIKVATLPTISKDLTDRNRTSPFAFTGNKFEFRAVGSKQSPSFPVSMLNAAVAAGMNEVAEALEGQKGSDDLSRGEIQAVLRTFITQTKSIRFEGDGYSAEWVKEAEKRGLLNIKSAPDAFKQLLEPVNHEMLTEELEIMSDVELNARFHVLCETYAKDLIIEAKTLKSIIMQHILPAIYKFRKDLAAGVAALVTINEDTPERSTLSILSHYITDFQNEISELERVLDQVSAIHGTYEHAVAAASLLPVMNKIRVLSDSVEEILADDVYPFPKYTELLFN